MLSILPQSYLLLGGGTGLASSTGTLRLTGTATLSVGHQLRADGLLTLAGTAALGPGAALAAAGTLTLTGSGATLSARAPISAAGTLRLTGVAVLTGRTSPVAASGTLSVTGTGTLTPRPAALAARGNLRLLGAGALSAGTDRELRDLRSEDIQRPVGYVEGPGGERLNVLRFTLDSSLDQPADGWTAEVAGAALMLSPDDEALYRLAVGLLNASDEEVIAAQIGAGRILDRRLVGRAAERRMYLRGYDALERTFRIRHRTRYVPEQGQVLVLDSTKMQLQTTLSERQVERATTTDPSRAAALDRIIIDLEQGVQAATEDEIPEEVGTWTASAIAAALVAGTGLTVSWECRDYTFAEPFDAVGTIYELLRKLVEPWCQVPPFGVDIFAVGSTIRLRARLKAPPADLTMTVKESRLVELELGDRRRLPLVGRVEFEGRTDETGSTTYSGESTPGIGEPVLPVLPWESVEPFDDRSVDGTGAEIGRVEGTRTYRMPDRLLIAYTERVWGKSPDGRYTVVKAEEGTLDFEDSHYGPQGPLNQPLPLRSQKLVDALIPGPTPDSPMILGRTLEERIAWQYDHRRFLKTTTTGRYKRYVAAPGLVTFPLTESVIETRTMTTEGWFRLATTTATFDPKTGKTTSSTTVPTTDQAGFPPGGPRLYWSFGTFISAPSRSSEATTAGASSRVRVTALLSDDPTAVTLRYSNANLSRADLDYILSQAREASGLVEYPLRGSGPALPDVRKGTAVHLTEYRDADGTSIPLDPALVTGIGFDYVDTRAEAHSTCALAAVFYRSE